MAMNTAGPYAKYRTNVIESCARLGTDHVDLNGEPLWIHEVLNQYDRLENRANRIGAIGSGKQGLRGKVWH